MADQAEDQESKTEEPSDKRKEQFAKEGQIAFSREIGPTLVFLSMVLMLNWIGASFYGSVRDYFSFTFSHLERWQGGVVPFYSHILPLVKPVLFAVIALLVVAFIVPILGHMAQKGIEPKWEAAAPSFDKLNPIQGVKNLVSKEMLVKTAINFLKTFGLMSIFYLTVNPYVSQIVYAADMPFGKAMAIFGNIFSSLLKNALVFLVTLAAFDYFLKRRMIHKKMMMTRQELKDEMKESDGNPEMKSKIRQIQRERSKRKANKEVPNATVVITNPTHFAIALKYSKGENPVPKVVAKGADYLAKKIRELAKDNRVPIVENPPLARAIYRDVKVGKEIPAKYYKAVAKIIATVLRLDREKKMQQQQGLQR